MPGTRDGSECGGADARGCGLPRVLLRHRWCANWPDAKGSLDIGDVVVNRDLRRSREQQANGFQTAVHKQTSRVAASGHGRRQDLVTEQADAGRSVPHDDSRVHRDHNSDRYLRRASGLNHECADARLIHALRHDCTDD